MFKQVVLVSSFMEKNGYLEYLNTTLEGIWSSGMLHCQQSFLSLYSANTQLRTVSGWAIVLFKYIRQLTIMKLSSALYEIAGMTQNI